MVVYDMPSLHLHHFPLSQGALLAIRPTRIKFNTNAPSHVRQINYLLTHHRLSAKLISFNAIPSHFLFISYVLLALGCSFHSTYKLCWSIEIISFSVEMCHMFHSNCVRERHNIKLLLFMYEWEYYNNETKNWYMKQKKITNDGVGGGSHTLVCS